MSVAKGSGVAEGSGVGVGVRVGVSVAVDRGVAEGKGVAVAVADGDDVAVEVKVGTGVFCSTATGVSWGGRNTGNQFGPVTMAAAVMQARTKTTNPPKIRI